MDFTFVTPRLATGARITAATDAQELLTAGITHIIDCRAEFDDSPMLASLGVHYLWNGTYDDGSAKPVSWFAKSLKFALPAFAHPHDKVYAHCAAGINRGPSTAYALMRALGWSAQSAADTIRAARPQVGLRYAPDADKAIVALKYAAA